MAFLDQDTFRTVMRHTPLVAIDLLVRDGAGKLLVGRRRNRPAMNTWFVPGGRIKKDERLHHAFARITEAELGQRFDLERGTFKGVFEHFYPDNALAAPGFGTHYVVLAYELAAAAELRLPEAQHSAYRWLSNAEVVSDPHVHENTKAYCR